MHPQNCQVSNSCTHPKSCRHDGALDVRDLGTQGFRGHDQDIRAQQSLLRHHGVLHSMLEHQQQQQQQTAARASEAAKPMLPYRLYGPSFHPAEQDREHFKAIVSYQLLFIQWVGTRKHTEPCFQAAPVSSCASTHPRTLGLLQCTSFHRSHSTIVLRANTDSAAIEA